MTEKASLPIKADHAFDRDPVAAQNFLLTELTAKRTPLTNADVDLLKIAEATELAFQEVEYRNQDSDRKQEFFRNTQQDRGFFHVGTSGVKGIGPYLPANFGEKYMAAYRANPQATIDFFQRKLQGKVVVMLGGGNSAIKTELKQKGIETDVLNFDPYTSMEKRESMIAANKKDEFDPLHETSVASPDFPAELWKVIPEGKEIIMLANTSVPYYLNSDEISSFFNNIEVILKRNSGEVRIAPLTLDRRLDESQDEFDLRILALRYSLKHMLNEGFEIHEINNGRGLVIRTVHNNELSTKETE